MRRPILQLTILFALALLLVAPQLLLAQYDINTVAGGGPNGSLALQSSIGYPDSLVLDGAGNTYIADFYANEVLKVSAAGVVTVVAGNGVFGYSGDGGPATSASLYGPESVALDSSGNIYIADTLNSLIRKVSAATGNISTVAGSYYGDSGCLYSGDGGPATSAQLCNPFSVFVDGSNNIFIADTGNEVIREVSASNGNIQTVAGNNAAGAGYSGDGGPATSAQLDFPEAAFLDSSGNIFIADSYNNLIRVVNTTTATIVIAGVSIPPGDIQTVAGSYYDSEGGTECATYVGSGVALQVPLCAPTGVFVDGSEDIFVADWGNSVIREMAYPSVNIATVAGDGTVGYSGDGGLATNAELAYPSNMFVDGSGDILIADTDNFVIREVASSTGDISTTIGNNFLSYSGDGGAAVDAQLNAAISVFATASDGIYIADWFNSVIRVANLGQQSITINGTTIQPSDIQTVAGNGTGCSAPTASCGDGGPATSAQFFDLSAVALDGAANIYIADTGDNRIRVVNTGSVAITLAGVSIGPADISTVAGSGNECTYPFTWPCGDGGVASNAELFAPQGVFVDSSGNIFIADTGDQAVRVVNTGTQPITLAGVTIQPSSIETIAGNGSACSSSTASCGDGGPSTSAQLSAPTGVFVDSSENVYIADSGDNRIRVINTSTQAGTIAGVTVQPGNIATVAGTGVEGYYGDGGAALSALLADPTAVFVDASGDIFISDTVNFVVREVVAASSWNIATIAGNNAAGPGFSGDGGVATSAQFVSPAGLFGDSNSNLFIADPGTSRIRELMPTSGAAPSASQPPPQTASPGGTATYNIDLNANTGNPRYPITLSCLQSTLPANATCSFSPATITPGPLPVPFTLTISVPASSAALHQPGKTRLEFVFCFVPLAGILLAGFGLRRRSWRHWLLLATLALFLVALSACGGGGSSSPSGTTYQVQVQGTWQTQSTPVTITTAVLTVQ